MSRGPGIKSRTRPVGSTWPKMGSGPPTTKPIMRGAGVLGSRGSGGSMALYTRINCTLGSTSGRFARYRKLAADSGAARIHRSLVARWYSTFAISLSFLSLRASGVFLLRLFLSLELVQSV